VTNKTPAPAKTRTRKGQSALAPRGYSPEAWMHMASQALGLTLVILEVDNIGRPEDIHAALPMLDAATREQLRFHGQMVFPHTTRADAERCFDQLDKTLRSFADTLDPDLTLVADGLVVRRSEAR